MALETPNVMHAAGVAVIDIRAVSESDWTFTLASGQGIEEAGFITQGGVPNPLGGWWQLTNAVDPALAVAMVRATWGPGGALLGPPPSPIPELDNFDQGQPGYGQVFTEAQTILDPAVRGTIALAIYRIPGG